MCRRCCHSQRVLASRSQLEECHRLVIRDSNGDDWLKPADQETCLVVGDVDGWAEVQDIDQILQDGGGSQDDVEEDDILAPLPELAPSRTAIVDSATGQCGHIVLLLDTSGSMRTADIAHYYQDDGEREKPAKLLSRFEASIRCAAEFAKAHSSSNPLDVFSLVTFNNDATVAGDRLSATALCEALHTLPCRCSNGTFYQAALHAGKEVLARGEAHNSAHVLMLSDGRPADPKDALTYAQGELLPTGCRLHGIGFGPLAAAHSFAPLQQLACLGGGAFVIAGPSIRNLCDSFASVSSTITALREHSNMGEQMQPGLACNTRKQRTVDFEVPELSCQSKRGVLRLQATCSAFSFDGSRFEAAHLPQRQVTRRLQPHMRGGMRSVYGFSDSQVNDEHDAGAATWMVAKSSRWVNRELNTRAVVEAHAKCSAVARHFAARFNEQRATKGAALPALFFVPCFVYEVDPLQLLPQQEARVFAAERYLPGVFLKYNSNNGFVSNNSKSPGMAHNEVVQAFAHFTFAASNGQLLVADLQGVEREAEVILTDPQVLSLSGAQFGPGDLRARGVHACLVAHRCGPTCKLLGLRPFCSSQLRRFVSSVPSAAQVARRRSGESSSGFDWEHCSDIDACSSDWERVSEQQSSNGQGSSQISEYSWVQLTAESAASQT